MKFSSHYIRLALAFIVYISAMGYVFAVLGEAVILPKIEDEND